MSQATGERFVSLRDNRPHCALSHSLSLLSPSYSLISRCHCHLDAVILQAEWEGDQSSSSAWWCWFHLVHLCLHDEKSAKSLRVYAVTSVDIGMMGNVTILGQTRKAANVNSVQIAVTATPGVRPPLARFSAAMAAEPQTMDSVTMEDLAPSSRPATLDPTARTVG